MKHSIAFLLLVVCMARTLADPPYNNSNAVYRVYIKNSHQQKIIDILLKQYNNVSITFKYLQYMLKFFFKYFSSIICGIELSQKSI